jgi:phage shock protein B
VSIPWALALPVIVFIAVIGPIWVVFHYVTAWKRMRAEALAEGEVAISAADLYRLNDVAEKLEARISSLETILDDEFPDWKTKTKS